MSDRVPLDLAAEFRVWAAQHPSERSRLPDVVRWLNEHGYRVIPNTWTAERVLPGDEELR